MYKLSTSKLFIYCFLLGTLSVLGSCIKNDIPYPRVHANFLKFEVLGQSEEAIINTATREVTLKLADTVDLKKVYIKSYAITDSATISPEPGQTIDLSSPQKFILRVYQDYEWTVKAEQVINRSLKIEGNVQVGETEFDTDNYIAVARVPMDVSLSNIRLSELKLGPSNAVISPDYKKVTDFSTPQKFTVKYRDITENWTVYIVQTADLATTVSANGWVMSAWLNGSGVEGADNGFEIRQVNSETWEKVPYEQLTIAGGRFSAEVTGLSPQTDYVCRAYSGNNYGQEIAFTTEAATPLNNGSFDNWSQNGKVWNPWAEGALSFWDTGNRGATTMGDSNTYPTDDTSNGIGKAAKLETLFVGLGGIGKLAAGNMFVGEYMATDGTNGILNFGRSFTSYPTRLRIHYKYAPVPIDYTSTEYTALKGRMDTCHIYIALGDWSAPVEIRTKPSERKLFDVNDPNIIGYADFSTAETTTSYQELELKLDYRTTDRKPTYLILVATASKYGDFFTGGNGSTLCIDDFELLYD